MTRVALLLFAALLPRIAAAQPQTMVRAAGMPLNDGALAPGMLTVRVVEGAFTRNLAEQAVEVQVTGGKTERAMTGADGRAQFAHLPIGAEVRIVALVGDERLESEKFAMPSESGVRLLLVAGSGPATTVASGSPDSTGLAAAPSSVAERPVVAPPVEQPGDPDAGVRSIRIALVLTTVFVFALFMLRLRQRRS